jgi:hypothetical protein
MHLYIQVLRNHDDLREALRRDGWEVEVEGPDAVAATHPCLPDTVAARDRLHQLGLLTSRFLRISFSYAKEEE